MKSVDIIILDQSHKTLAMSQNIKSRKKTLSRNHSPAFAFPPFVHADEASEEDPSDKVARPKTEQSVDHDRGLVRLTFLLRQVER